MMANDTYKDLLNMLDSDEPVKIAKPSARSISHKGGFRYEVESTSPLKETYSKEEIQGFLGFAVSIVASIALNTSISVAASLIDPKTLKKKLTAYEDMAKELGQDIEEGAVALCVELINTISKGVLTAFEDDEATGPEKLNDSVNLQHMVATVVTCYVMGRNLSSAFTKAQEKGEEFNTEEHRKIIGRLLAHAVSAAYRSSKFLSDPELQEMVNNIIDDMLEDETVKAVEDGTLEPEALKEAIKAHVKVKSGEPKED